MEIHANAKRSSPACTYVGIQITHNKPVLGVKYSAAGESGGESEGFTFVATGMD